jgi:predicted phage replisome organizer
MSEKRFYWLKLPKDFFKRHDIKFIQTLPNGDKTILFYLKLMAESVDHEGELRFSPKIPYTEEMLASATDTPVEIVKAALKTLKDLDLVTVSRNGTIKVEKVASMIGYETKWAEKKRAWRDQQKQKDNERTDEGQKEDNVLDMSSQCPQGVLTMSDKSKRESKSKRKSQSKSIEIYERESKERDTHAHFEPPTVEEVYLYCEQRHNGIDAQRFIDYYTARGWKNVTDWRAQIRVWESRVGVSCES